jgi:hypothetical protein
MRTFILIFILLSARVVLFAQETIISYDSRPLNSIYINLLGDASIISINYDKQFLISSNFILSGKLGLGYNEEFQICLEGSCPSPDKYLTIPHHITGNIGKDRHFFEFGLGGTIISGNTPQKYLLYPIVGYRILPLQSKKVNFRIFGQIPFSGLETKDILFVPFGLSLGVSF